jgi:ADP-ribosylglycohydrolase
LLIKAVQGRSKDELLSSYLWHYGPLAPKIDYIARGSFKEKHPPEIRGTGYVVHSLEAALWAFYRTTSFREGCLLAVNLGDDADTTGAIFGQLAGAYYGERAIPRAWKSKIAKREQIEDLADWLFERTVGISCRSKNTALPSNG